MPKKKKKKHHVQKPAKMRWDFGPAIPTYEFFHGLSLDGWGLGEAVDNFVHKLERGDFLTWEAVACHEQGLPLTAAQEEALDGLLNFGDPDDDRIHYINGIPRTKEPWYVILNRILPHLLIVPFRTYEVQEDVKCDGWKILTDALQKYGHGLSLPPEAASLTEVVPADLRHKLWLQYCFDILSGLSQEEELNLEAQPWRLEQFAHRLMECKEGVAHLALSLESLMARVILPERDQPIFVREMKTRLGLTSTQEPIAVHL